MTIDPGVQKSAWAIFDTSQLVAKGFCSTEDIRGSSETFWGDRNGTLLIECPQIYDVRSRKGDQSDLIDLAMTVGRWTQECVSSRIQVGVIKPFDWKGSMPKDVHHKRILAALSNEEFAMLGRTDHNVRDAIGLGLWFCQRLKTPSRLDKIRWKV